MRSRRGGVVRSRSVCERRRNDLVPPPFAYPHPRRACFMDKVSEGKRLLKRVRRRGPLRGGGAHGK